MKILAKTIKSLIVIISMIVAISCDNNDTNDEIIPESGTATAGSVHLFDYEIYDFPNVTQGMYFLKIQGENFVKTEKIVFE